MTATEQKWAERVQGWRESGLSATEYAEGREFSAGGLRHWAYRLKKRGAEAATSRPVVRVVRVDRAAQAAALTVEIGPARLSVPAGADAMALRLTIAALVDAARGGTR